MFGGEAGGSCGCGFGGERKAGGAFYVAAAAAITRKTTHQCAHHCSEAATGDYVIS